MRNQHLRLLLVDDDEDDYVITRDILNQIEGWAFDIDWVSTYAEALKNILECRHDIYLLDYRLGERTGLDLLRDALNSGCKEPIILMTGQGDLEVDMEAMLIGAADYLNKEKVDPPLLERSIRYSLERNRALNTLLDVTSP